jgi:hypothetical protein
VFLEALQSWLVSNRLANQATEVILRRRARRFLVDFDHQDPIRAQARVLCGLVHKAKATPFGRDHDFRRIRTPADFRRLVPLDKQVDETADTSNPDLLSHALAAQTAFAFADALRTLGRRIREGVTVRVSSEELGQQLNALLPIILRSRVHFHSEGVLPANGAPALDSIWTGTGAIALEDPRHGHLRLLTDHRIYFEFVPLEQVGQPNPARLDLGEVEPGAAYALVLTSAAGLWARLTDIAFAFERRNPPLVTRIPAQEIPKPLILQPPHRQIVDTRAVRPEMPFHNPWSAPVDLG